MILIRSYPTRWEREREREQSIGYFLTDSKHRNIKYVAPPLARSALALPQALIVDRVALVMHIYYNRTCVRCHIDYYHTRLALYCSALEPLASSWNSEFESGQSKKRVTPFHSTKG